MTLLGVIGPQELIVILVVLLFFLLFPILALVDILRSKFEGNMQLIWVLVVLLFNMIGSILYFIIGTKQKVRP
ncbi:MAG TPA: hypothetical protein DCL77_15355 [Prolixibacteraceae bacterium]|jgi:hypothetical protein|nr:hypothetical protein [Prolixibacteraceae bacterium]